MKDVLVVIPIYKERFGSSEEENVTNNISKLSSYDTVFVGPKGLDKKYYKDLFCDILIEGFDDKYFNDIAAYNRLMLSDEFYERFLDYRYICICQPDVWVIKGNKPLDEFIDKGYDYYGAPWMPSHMIPISKKYVFSEYGIKSLFKRRYIVSVGNGGFSMRNVAKSLELLRGNCDLRDKWDLNEDYFYALVGKYCSKDYRIAPKRVAVLFGQEQKSREYIEKKNIIPVAVHAYEKVYPNIDKSIM